MNKVAFEALIKSIQNKSLVSGDKATRLTIEFDSGDKTELLNTLNHLHLADNYVKIEIKELQ